MKNKAYFIRKLCKLRNIDPESEEAEQLEKRKIVDILIDIKNENEKLEIKDSEEEEEELTFSKRAGCRN